MHRRLSLLTDGIVRLRASPWLVVLRRSWLLFVPLLITLTLGCSSVLSPDHGSAHQSQNSRPTWRGSFTCGCINPVLYPHASFVKGHVFVVSDPSGSGKKVLAFAIANSDAPSDAREPRGDVESPPLFRPGASWYVSVPVLIPTSLSAVTRGKWFQIAEIYGPPYDGSPTIGIDLTADGNGHNHLALGLDATHSGTPWVGPALDGRWHTVILHVHFAVNDTGYVELWYDNVQQTFTGYAQNVTLTNHGKRLNYATLVPGINWDGQTANFLDIDSYRLRNAFPGLVTIYHGAPAVGKTLASVQGNN